MPPGNVAGAQARDLRSGLTIRRMDGRTDHRARRRAPSKVSVERLRGAFARSA